MRRHNERTIRENAAWSYETARFFVGFYAEDEDMDPEDSFDDPEDIELARQGGSHWFTARVSVYLKDDSGWMELGSDYLGGCSYNSIREFYTAWRTDPDESRNTLAMKDKGIVICHHFPEMVREAIRETRRELARMGDISATMRAGAEIWIVNTEQFFNALEAYQGRPLTPFEIGKAGGLFARHSGTDQTVEVRTELHTALWAVLRDALAYNNRLNDPHNDDTGIDATAPDGDSYNDLLAIIEPLFSLVKMNAP